MACTHSDVDKAVKGMRLSTTCLDKVSRVIQSTQTCGTRLLKRGHNRNSSLLTIIIAGLVLTTHGRVLQDLPSTVVMDGHSKANFDSNPDTTDGTSVNPYPQHALQQVGDRVGDDCTEVEPSLVDEGKCLEFYKATGSFINDACAIIMQSVEKEEGELSEDEANNVQAVQWSWSNWIGYLRGKSSLSLPNHNLESYLK